jgi:hypothetical protein
MRKLTLDEEILILEKVKGKDYIHRGSSRAVYSFEDNMVIKIARDVQGINQNRKEVSTWRKVCGTPDAGFFAEIYFYGRRVVIMERLECVDYEELQYIIEDEDWSSLSEMEEKKKLFRKMEQAIFTICDYIGDTSDIYQLGTSLDGCVKIYDYGFAHSSERSFSVSDYGPFHMGDSKYCNHNEFPGVMVSEMKIKRSLILTKS